MSTRPTGPALADAVRRRRLRRRIVGLALLWSVWTVLAAEFGPGPVRAVSVALFLLAVPGAAVTAWLHIDDFVFEATLVFGIGIAVGVATGEILVWTANWDPKNAIDVVATLCAVSLMARLVWSPPPEGSAGHR
jgi:uncharacterized membrane protein YfcA